MQYAMPSDHAFCWTCVHFLGLVQTGPGQVPGEPIILGGPECEWICSAFPKGIPWEILEGNNSICIKRMSDINEFFYTPGTPKGKLENPNYPFMKHPQY